VGFVVVAGCLAQLWGEKCFNDISPEIDAVVRLDQRERLPQIIHSLINGTDKPGGTYGNEKYSGPVGNDQARLRLTAPNWSYLRVSEGCNRHCSYCTIPLIRGEFRSKPLEAIMAEARELIADGAIELNLIGQETTAWGTDIPGSGGISRLLRELNKLEGLFWLRVIYTHPASISDDFIAAVAQCDRVVPYIDMPLQHINDRMLKQMNRKVTHQDVDNIIAKLRKALPDLALRTTFIVGFPSETDAEFQELLDFVKETRFDMLGAFTYSPEPGTVAATIPGQIEESVKEQRLETLMLAQQEIAFDKAQSLVGKEFDCLLVDYAYEDEMEENQLDSELQWFSGRTAFQGPEVDSVTWIGIDDPEELVPGMVLKVKIIDAIDYDLIAVPVWEEI
ncbi:MAG: MiaB/RimO family radical SAM methylthiotransferase, partial [Sedimentisphaerales bacterium]|nr:MiaB/RimO family radical SAM methylthiotransferase [Sedimentisphaerales bacterium]